MLSAAPVTQFRIRAACGVGSTTISVASGIAGRADALATDVFAARAFDAGVFAFVDFAAVVLGLAFSAA